MVVAALGVVIALVMAGAVILSNRPSGASHSDGGKEALETYTASLQSQLERLGPVGKEMADAPREISDETDARSVAAKARSWERRIERAKAEAAAVQPGPQAVASYQVVTQAIVLLGSAAKTCQLAPDVDPKAQSELLQGAAEQRDEANLLWQTGVGLLDQERAKAGLGPSGLQAPVPAAAPAGSSPSSGSQGNSSE
jgi:hypothetical protein